MSILNEIIEYKRLEVEYQKGVKTIKELRNAIPLNGKSRSLKDRLMSGQTTGIIAEFKRKSPSKKDMNLDASLPEIVSGYQDCNVAGISVLTEERFFAGSLKDLNVARKTVDIPILRKDFIIDEYQLYEAKANGADVILLIAACLDQSEIHDLAHHARALGLEVLLELHSEDELKKVSPFVDLVGVNNRNLNNFETNIQHSLNFYAALPKDKALISESGIHQVEDALSLLNAGFHGLLIGGQFMQNENPSKACEAFSKDLVYQRMISKQSETHAR